MDNDIKTESGQVIGQWDGEKAEDLMRELQRILKMYRHSGSTETLNPRDMPHRHQLPEDLHTFKAYRLWGCDKQQICVVGTKADRLESVDKVRTFSLIDHH